MNVLDIPLLLATLRLATPILFAALGGLLTERAGVIALHLESALLGGALASVAVTAATSSPVLGLLAGIVAGSALGLLHGVLTQALRVPHILSGVALNLGTLGFTTFALRQFGSGMNADRLLPPWLLSSFALFSLVAVWWTLEKTALGLRLRACGENPRAARVAGLSVPRLRYGALAAAGALTGLGGVALTLTGLGAFTENMTAGRGYIALAAVIFGRWNPVGTTIAALLFGFGDALQLSLQTAGLARIIPPDLLALLPYVLTLAALAGLSRRANAPASLGEVE